MRTIFEWPVKSPTASFPGIEDIRLQLYYGVPDLELTQNTNILFSALGVNEIQP